MLFSIRRQIAGSPEAIFCPSPVGSLADTLLHQLWLDCFFLQPFLHREGHTEDFFHLGFETFEIPLFGVGTRGACGNHAVDRVVTHIDDDIVHRFAVHDFGALFVDDLALVVHHVVVLDDLLADVAIARLDLFLRGFDGLGEPLGPDCLAIFEIGVHHAGEQSIRAEDAQQIVFQAEVEAA